MASRMSDRNRARSELVAAGYKLVQIDAQLEPSSGFRADVVGWASDVHGELVPWVAVEVKNGIARPELALPALAKARDVLGTVDHYAMVNGEWFRADESVRSLDVVDGPVPPPYGTDASLAEETLATSLLLQSLWADANRRRGSGLPDFVFNTEEGVVVVEAKTPGIRTEGGFVPVQPDVLWRARRKALLEFAGRSGRGTEAGVSNPVIASAVAGLAGRAVSGTVLDPFCGSGAFLWAAMDRAQNLGTEIRCFGVELDEHRAGLARTVAETAPMQATIATADALGVELPMADLVLAAPPLGMRARPAHTLLNGGSTTDMTVAAIDLALRHLRDGGRAVLHVAAAFTFQREAEPYREFLASEYRVAALIGVPGGAVPGTGVRSVLIVIDRSEPGETFVAHLGEDWETQLDPRGAAMDAALSHIDGDRRGT